MKKFTQFRKFKQASIMFLLMVINANCQEILWHSIDGGGGISTGDNNIKLLGVIGQQDTIRMSAENTSLSGGFLPLPVDGDLIFKDSFE